MTRVGAIILAAGSSSRLGQPKQLLPYRDKTLIEHVIDVAAASGCEPTVVVTGAVDEPIRSVLPKQVPVIHNAAWSTGMGSSIQAGLARLFEVSPDIDRVLVLLSDQPALSEPIVRQLLKTWVDSRRPMAACSYGGSVGPPCGFDRSCFTALMQLAPENGAKALLRPADRVATIDWPQGAIDIDTPDDLQQWRSTE